MSQLQTNENCSLFYIYNVYHRLGGLT